MPAAAAATTTTTTDTNAMEGDNDDDDEEAGVQNVENGMEEEKNGDDSHHVAQGSFSSPNINVDSVPLVNVVENGNPFDSVHDNNEQKQQMVADLAVV